MRRGSIRIRLLLVGALSIVAALTLGGIGLRYLFERHVERRVEVEMAADLNQLIGSTSFTADGRLLTAPLRSDPRFETPLSGYYWQVEDVRSGTLQRSRSLWDGALVLPAQPASAGSFYLRETAGPGGEPLSVVYRTVEDPSGASFRAAVGQNRRAIEASVNDYVGELIPSLALLGGLLAAANFAQIAIGLAPLEKLRIAVRDLVGRREARLDVVAPDEVQPLADEINRMLEAQEKALARARTRAADLAHGLKTPLQVLSGDIRTLRQKGEADLADEIAKSVTSIRRHVDRELARARINTNPTGKTACSVARTARSVIDVVRRTPAAEGLEFTSNIAPELLAPVEEYDLSEVLGNLVENAARFARSSVAVEAAASGAGIEVSIVDDGPGIAATDRDSVTLRGVRLDRSGGGSGLGLAIVADIVDAYGGQLSLSDACPAGLRVRIWFPRQPVLETLS